MTALATGLAGTAALLKALAPPPLAPDASLLAVAAEPTVDQVFDTPIAFHPGRWKSIYVHQSLTPTGDPTALEHGRGSLADHFVIGNGAALSDGALQIGTRWNQQSPAGDVVGVDISDDCISICLVGNFNHVRPTAAQQARLVELLTTLQKQLSIPGDHVVLGLDSAPRGMAGLGERFPVEAIQRQLYALGAR